MKGGLAYGLAQLSGRERMLVAALFLIVVPVAAVFLGIMPLMEARDKAQNKTRENQILLDWVSDQVRQMPVGAGTEEKAQDLGSNAIGLSGVEQSLVDAGLRDQVSQLSDKGDGGIDLVLENAPFELVGQWVDNVAPIWGYEIAAFQFDLVEPGLIRASFELEVAR